MVKQNVVLRNGEQISYHEHGDSDKVLILVHGNLSSSVIFTPIVNKLAEEFKVYNIDLRGFGDSSYFRRVTAVKDFSEDIYFFMNALKIKKATIVGWDLGGAIAMDFASRYAPFTDSIVLISSNSHSGHPVYKRNSRGNEIYGAVYSNFEEMREDLKSSLPYLEAVKNKDYDYVKNVCKLHINASDDSIDSFCDVLVEEVIKQRNILDVTWALTNFNMSYQHNFYNSGSNRINNVKCPVLHIWGEEDQTIPEYLILENIKVLEQYSQYIKYPNVGHVPMVDIPDKLSEDIINFINKN